MSRVCLPLRSAFLVCSLAACQDDVVNSASPDELASIVSASVAAPVVLAPGAGGPGASAAVPKLEFSEEDFAETDRNRDPFRSFLDLFVEHPAQLEQSKQPVILENVALEDLRLIAVITGIVPATAMVVDPGGKGFVIKKNDFVGRAERVQVGTANTEYEINWKVDQIRESDVVFVREDPSNPDVPSATRVVSLRTKEEEQALQPN